MAPTTQPMARIRRLFVSAILIDAVVASYVLLAALLHSVSSSRRDHTDERAEMAPFIGHALHAFIGVLGLGAIRLPGSSFFARALRPVAAGAFVGDSVALAMHATSLSTERLADECAVYTLIAALLAASALNVYVRSSGELTTFDLAADARHR